MFYFLFVGFKFGKQFIEWLHLSLNQVVIPSFFYMNLAFILNIRFFPINLISVILFELIGYSNCKSHPNIYAIFHFIQNFITFVKFYKEICFHFLRLFSLHLLMNIYFVCYFIIVNFLIYFHKYLLIPLKALYFHL